MANDSGVAAARQLDIRLDRAVSRLDRSPARCRVVPELRAEGLDMYRELIVRPYRVMFRLGGTDVVLLAVVDARRDLEALLLERTLAE